MASKIEQYTIWDNAKKLSSKWQFNDALELYRSVETDFINLNDWHANKSEKNNMFDQAMFFGDFCGVLCNAGFYDEAVVKGNIALKCIKKGDFSALKYIYYNVGNIYLFQKEYAQACPWYMLALEGTTYLYASANDYLVNYGIAKFFQPRFPPTHNERGGMTAISR